MYIRRIYYDDNGRVLHTYMEQGDIVLRTKEEDCDLFNLPENVHVIEQFEPDTETEEVILSVGWNEGKHLEILDGDVICVEDGKEIEK